MDGIHESLRLILWQRLVQHRSVHSNHTQQNQHR